MAHCFGDAPKEDDLLTKGTAVSRLLSLKFARDAYTGQPIMANIAVRIRPLSAAGDVTSEQAA
jgi:hypothetical protein